LKSLFKQESIAVTVFDRARKSPSPHRSRIHLLAAREAPVIVILQRKRAKLFHVITVGTEKRWINEGSWFRGVLYALDTDVSFDGKFMVYRARGANNQTWGGLCRLPWLKTLVHVETPITGGGYFSGPNDLKTHGWDCSEKIVSSDDVHFTIGRDTKRHFGDELAVIYGRLERDGFVRLGDNWGEEQTFKTPRAWAMTAGAAGLLADTLSFSCATWAFSTVHSDLPSPSMSTRTCWPERTGRPGTRGIIFGWPDPASSSNIRLTI
jgi:hypothetical protein